MSKVKLTVEMNGQVHKAEHDGVVIVAIDKADDGGVNISTLANMSLVAGYNALGEAIENEKNIANNNH